ncbi:flagellar biosynthetic protein FliR [Aneurinibacillus sp. Ricciae_BoGa-3]|uniref:flagellar biosynthetic protein FliR n=1 Tax=Aneurinibacillus sp. Ricciae_BoGa-3 TaxID=3022697 RepID=UPI00233FD24B|nr:flagellar biosynthetic protein FliR [Aneurinibacillus sp. Ricciae_BoGa-3]WCK52883.1 flagellar biosynthetic protein FliR [Aneurinibacillus sp. Ricciae_BoGa-3]
MNLLLNLLPGFMLVFIRLTAFFLTAPIFSSRNIPGTYKIGLSFYLALIAYPLVKADGPVQLDWFYVMLVLKEVIVGLVIGFIGMMLLSAIQMAGSLIDMVMGFSMSNVIDPMTGAQAPLMGNFKFILTMLFILTVNGHHLLIQGILSSYQVIPLDRWLSGMANGNISTFLVQKFSYMFLSGLLLAAPLISSMFVVDVGLGIAAKTVPQLNIFVVGMPAKLLAGFLILLIIFPGYFYVMTRLLENLFSSMAQLINIMGAGT